MPEIIRLRARWILPILSPPIEHGEVIVQGDRILDVRSSAPAGTDRVQDFHDAIIMPGLVNVHTHIEYTLMRGLLEDIPFFPWLRGLVEKKAKLNQEDWIVSSKWGAAEAVATGITTIGDCTDSGAALDGALAFGLGGVIYQEVFGIEDTPAVDQIVRELDLKVASLQSRATPRLHVGISPALSLHSES